MMEALARRGFRVEVLCGPMLQLGQDLDLSAHLAARGLSFELQGGDLSAAGRLDGCAQAPLRASLELRGVPTTVLWGPTPPRPITDEQYQGFLRLFDDACTRLRPDVVVSFGGGTLTREIFRRAKGFGASTVFPLHNLRYNDRVAFADVDDIIVASRFAAEHYRSTLGLECAVLPNLVDWDRARAIDRRGRYVVFVNPTIEKGVAVFARIADVLGLRRPDIPFLVVEGAGTEADVAACGLDLRLHGNVFFHEHTHDPRRFWRRARICLLPSLVAENQPLVAIEAMINGVPVIGSNRGGIPEVLGMAGTVLPIPDHLSPTSVRLPTAEEIGPWVEAIVALWDLAETYDEASRRAQSEAERWAAEATEPLYEQFFAAIGPDL
jgi:glycosyltransferase involved in cell wall biosynthesis